MASGSQNMTTYNARTVTGSNSAASPAGALLLSGAHRANNATGDTWIFLDSYEGTSAPWGIKHDQVNNKIQIFGAGTNSVWTEMDTGNTYIGGSLNTGSTLIVRAQDDAHEGGEIILSPATDSFSTIHIDAYDSMFRLHDGTNERFKIDISTGNATINGNLGIGADYAVLGGSYKLYVNGDSYFTNTITGDATSAWHILGGRPANTTNFNTHFETTDNLHHDNPARTDVELTYNRFFLSHSDQTTYGPSALHLPVVDQHVLSFGIDNGATYSRHMAFDIRTNAVYVRARTNNTWGNWEELVRNTGKWSIDITGHADKDLALSGGTMTGNISFSNSGTAFRGINYGTMGDNDQWRIGGAATAANAGYMELATADDGNEPIYVRQYTGVFSSLKRTLTLLDASGNTYVPGRLFVASNSDVGLNSGSGAIVIGSTSGTSIGIDDNEIMARSSNAASTLYINSEGGNVYIGSGGITSVGKITGSGGYADRTNGTATYLNYGASGLAASAISWLCCWNGYEIRAISKGEMANAVDGSHKWARIGGDTITGVLHSSYKSGSWVNSLTNSAITIDDAAGSYGGWICGPTKNGRIAISTYQSSDDILYIGYGERGRTTNSFTRSMTWNGANGRLTIASVANAIWNDIAESRVSDIQTPGYVIAPDKNKIAHITTKRLQSAGRIISDTYGYLLGDEDDEHALVAIAGRVLAYPLHDKSYYEVGDAVCAAEGGKIDKMTREEIKEYPDRIIGIVNEIPDYDIWEPSCEEGGREPIHTNGRIWIDVR